MSKACSCFLLGLSLQCARPLAEHTDVKSYYDFGNLPSNSTVQFEQNRASQQTDLKNRQVTITILMNKKRSSFSL
jgi:hypothetical protein